MQSDISIIITSPGEYSLHLNGCPYLSDNFYVNFYEFSLLMSDSELNIDSTINICLEEDPVLITPFDDFSHLYIDEIPLDTDIYNENMLSISEILDVINLNQVYSYKVEIDFQCDIIASNNSVISLLLNASVVWICQIYLHLMVTKLMIILNHLIIMKVSL